VLYTHVISGAVDDMDGITCFLLTNCFSSQTLFLYIILFLNL
jgi:hypothetical protein